MRARAPASSRFAFTLVELLVVIAVISLLIAIIVPATRHALALARGSKSLSHLRQLAAGMSLYAAEQKGFLPAGAYPAPPTPRIRWADAIWPYMGMVEMYLSPQLNTGDLSRMLTPFAHDATRTFGGYGYNYQYLGNGRHVTSWTAPYNAPFHAKIGSMLRAPASTVLLGDTDGTKAEQIDNASGQTMASPWSSQPLAGPTAVEPGADAGWAPGCLPLRGGRAGPDAEPSSQGPGHGLGPPGAAPGSA